MLGTPIVFLFADIYFGEGKIADGTPPNDLEFDLTPILDDFLIGVLVTIISFDVNDIFLP